MLSRTILRSLPRTASRIIPQSARSSLRPATHSTSALRSALPRWRTGPSRAAFSTSARRFDDVAQELSAKLTNEIALEEENSDAQADSDAGVKRFLEENSHWNLEAPDGQQDVVLRRQYDDELITVAFSVVDFNTTMPLDEDADDEAFLDEEDDVMPPADGSSRGTINQAGGKNPDFKVAPEDSIAPADTEDPLRGEEEYDDSQQAFPANVNVLIQRAGKGALRVNLVADNGRFAIHGVTHLPESSPAASASDLLRQTHEQLYTGPPFQQLDEELQGLLEQYLDIRGINTALALFIPDYIDVKEQKEYVGWLGRVKEFVD